MKMARNTQIAFMLVALYVAVKLATNLYFVPLAVRLSLQAFLRGIFPVCLLGILSYTTYMVIRRRENIWIVFFVIWSVVCFFLVPISIKQTINYAKEAIAASKPAIKEPDVAHEIATIHNQSELDTFVASSIKPIAIKISAPWCGPCQAMKPHYGKLAAELGNQITFAEINFDEFPDKEMLNVKGIPLVICYKNGKEAFRVAGYRDKNALRQELTKLIS